MTTVERNAMGDWSAEQYSTLRHAMICRDVQVSVERLAQ